MTTTSSEATLTPTIDFGGVIEDLTGDDLDSLGLGDLDLTVPLEKLETDVSILVGLVAEALNLLGLQRLGIPPGLGLDVGFSTTFDVRGSVSVPLSVSPGGFLNGFVQSIASSSPADAQGVSSISGAVHVATAPEGFPDPEKLDLALEFESGRRMKVYLASALVFIDGFEFGDTLAWSGSVP